MIARASKVESMPFLLMNSGTKEAVSHSVALSAYCMGTVWTRVAISLSQVAAFVHTLIPTNTAHGLHLPCSHDCITRISGGFQTPVPRNRCWNVKVHENLETKPKRLASFNKLVRWHFVAFPVGTLVVERTNHRQSVPWRLAAD
jgi:hypothetical protein